MTHWNHYIVTGARRIDLSDIKAALQAVNPAFQIDENTIWHPDAQHGELAYAGLTFEDFENTTAVFDREFFSDQCEGKRSEAMLQTVFDNAQSMITLQLFNTGLWWNKEYAQTLAPLQDWLLNNVEGVLYVEGGEFYNRAGLLE